jgi:tetratricopeptide (TPR) repeat protein
MIMSAEEPTVTDLRDKMQTAFLKREYKRALEYCNAMLDQHPDDLASALYSRGLIYSKLMEDDKAIRDFTEAIQLNPNYTVAYLDRGIVYERRDLQANAMSDYNRAIALEPHNARPYRDRADLEDDLGLCQNAIDDYTTALRYSPESIDVLNNRAGVYYKRGQFQKAMVDYSHCLKIDPQDPDAAYNLAKCYLSKGELQRAIGAFSLLINSHPNYVAAYSGRAATYLKQGDRERAIADARRGLTLTPVDDWDFYYRSPLHQILNDDDASLIDLRAALQRYPSSALYRNLSAWLLATSPDDSLRDGREAVKLAQQANESTGWRDAGYVDTLAAAYAEIGNIEKAVEYQELAANMEARTLGASHKALEARLELYRKHKPYRKPQGRSLHEPD